MTNRKASTADRTKKLVGMALFAAIVVVLQLIGSFIKIGSFSISLVLLPIVVGAAVYGSGAGAFLGGVFGLMVTIATVNGTDQGAYILFTARPFITVALCMVKGIAAGYFAGLVYNLLSKKNKYLAVITSAVICPVVNTGIFCLAMVLFYHETLVAWAGGTSIAYYVIFVLVGVNFLLEMLINVVLSPVVLRILDIKKAV